MSETTLATARPFPIARDLIDAASRELRDNRIVYLILAGWIAYTATLAVVRNDGFGAELLEYGSRAFRAATVLFCATFVIVTLRVVMGRPKRPLRALLPALGAALSAPTVARHVFGYAVFAAFMAAFLYNKTLIPELAPFSWDETFSGWDKALFGGRHPWELLQPLLGQPGFTLVFDFAYVAWVPGVFLFWSWMFASRRVPQALRRQFWVATMLSWILLGIVMATWLSSAGPCFLPQLFPGAAADYAPLNAYLDQVHQRFVLASGLTKEHLWGVYAGVIDEPGGISAMPSMHNAQAALFVLAAYRVHRGFGHVMLLYATLIFVASILLAWHYAVDGLAGVAGAVAIWWLAGKLARARQATA